MNAPTHRPLETPSLSFADASDILDQVEVHRAYLLDAVTVGLHMANESEQRGYAKMLRPLFTIVQDDDVYFGLFEGQVRVAFLHYRFAPDVQSAPLLEETDDQHRGVGPSALTRKFQPIFDHVLGKMEQQVWDRVKYA